MNTTATTNPTPNEATSDADETRPAAGSSATPPASAMVICGPLDTSECKTLLALEQAAVKHVSDALIKLVHDHDPLKKENSTAVWLLPDLSIEAEEVARLTRRYTQPTNKTRMLLELFRGTNHATPNSPHHEWVSDPQGKYFGASSHVWTQKKPLYYGFRPELLKVAGPTTEQLWQHLSWRRFSIKSLPQAALYDRLVTQFYRADLRETVNAWLYSGACAAAFKNLNFASVKLGCVGEGRALEKALGGPEPLCALLLSKAEAHLRAITDPEQNE